MRVIEAAALDVMKPQPSSAPSTSSVGHMHHADGHVSNAGAGDTSEERDLGNRSSGEGQQHTSWTGFEVTEMRLEEMNFGEQLKMLQRTDVLVAQYGTGKRSFRS